MVNKLQGFICQYHDLLVKSAIMSCRFFYELILKYDVIHTPFKHKCLHFVLPMPTVHLGSRGHWLPC